MWQKFIELTGTIVKKRLLMQPLFLTLLTGRLIQNAMVKYGQTY
jgi:hypothetical protein